MIVSTIRGSFAPGACTVSGELVLNLSTLSLELWGDEVSQISVRLFQMTLKGSGILDPPVTETAMLKKVLGMR